MKSEQEIEGLLRIIMEDLPRAEQESDKSGAEQMCGAIGALRWVLEIQADLYAVSEDFQMLDNSVIIVGQSVAINDDLGHFQEGNHMSDNAGLHSNPVSKTLIQKEVDEARHEQGGSIQEGTSENPHKPDGDCPDYMGEGSGGGDSMKDYGQTKRMS